MPGSFQRSSANASPSGRSLAEPREAHRHSPNTSSTCTSTLEVWHCRDRTDYASVSAARLLYFPRAKNLTPFLATETSSRTLMLSWRLTPPHLAGVTTSTASPSSALPLSKSICATTWTISTAPIQGQHLLVGLCLMDTRSILSAKDRPARTFSLRHPTTYVQQPQPRLLTPRSLLLGWRGHLSEFSAQLISGIRRLRANCVFLDGPSRV